VDYSVNTLKNKKNPMFRSVSRETLERSEKSGNLCRVNTVTVNTFVERRWEKGKTWRPDDDGNWISAALRTPRKIYAPATVIDRMNGFS
jgi:hypothetical protein